MKIKKKIFFQKIFLIFSYCDPMVNNSDSEDEIEPLLKNYSDSKKETTNEKDGISEDDIVALLKNYSDSKKETTNEKDGISEDDIVALLKNYSDSEEETTNEKDGISEDEGPDYFLLNKKRKRNVDDIKLGIDTTKYDKYMVWYYSDDFGKKLESAVCIFDDENNTFVDLEDMLGFEMNKIVKFKKIKKSESRNSSKEQDEMEVRIFQRLVDMFAGYKETQNYLKSTE